MISIIIPLYNKKKTIGKTLRSIFNQTYHDIEVILVDDGSTDKGLEDVKEFEDVRILQQKQMGANIARNRGAQEARGDYLFFCDADIELKKDALNKMKKALDDNPSASYAYCGFKLGWKKFKSRKFDAEELKKRNYISTMSLIRREDFPGFDEDLKKFQDWDLWLTMLKNNKKGTWVPKILFRASPSRHGKSRWLPKAAYRFSWLTKVKEYNRALQVIKEKHNL